MTEMDGFPIASLSPEVRSACERLRDRLLHLLGRDLAALWAYGAAVSPGPPARLGDVDVHGVLTRPPSAQQAVGMEAARRELESDLGLELDVWYILERDAQGSQSPAHLLLPDQVDDMWALHRCHLLSGRYVLLQGAPPARIVRWPIWVEVLAALRHECAYMEEGLRLMDEEQFGRYVVLNCCRIAHTLATGDAAWTKLESGRWALTSLPQQWREPVLSALRSYDSRELPGDDRLLRESGMQMVAFVRGLLS